MTEKCRYCAAETIEWDICATCENIRSADKFIGKATMLNVVRLWLNEEVLFNGCYYPRRRVVTATQLEDFLSERLK